jgi:hypothetical protein
MGSRNIKRRANPPQEMENRSFRVVLMSKGFTAHSLRRNFDAVD